MVRRLLLPLLGFALLATEAASAQNPTVAPVPAPAPAKPAVSAYSHATPRTGRTLTARERRAAEVAAKVEADQAAKAAVAAQAQRVDSAATANTALNGWSNQPLPQADSTPHRPAINLSVAPGMPINQVGHGVTTDYNGRPLHHPEVANTTLPTGR